MNLKDEIKFPTFLNASSNGSIQYDLTSFGFKRIIWPYFTLINPRCLKWRKFIKGMKDCN